MNKIIYQEIVKKENAVKKAFEEKATIKPMSDPEVVKRIEDRTSKWGKL